MSPKTSPDLSYRIWKRHDITLSEGLESFSHMQSYGIAPCRRKASLC